MSRLKLAALCLSALSAPSFAQTPAPSPAVATPAAYRGDLKGALYDGILVTVGDEIILLSDLRKAVRLASNGAASIDASGKIKGAGVTEKDVNQLLDQLIDQRILALKVRELNIGVNDDELETEIDNFLKGQNLTRERFLVMLRDEGETFENYREEFRRQLETQRFVGRVIRPLVSVTDDELRNVYLQKSGTSERAQKLKLRSLMLNVTGESNKKLESIKNSIAKGADFAAVVKQYSESPDAQKNGGMLPPKSPGELPAEVWKKLKDAKLNDVVGPFTIGSAIFFFQYVGRDINNLADFEKQKAQLESQLLEAKFQERLAEYLKAERSKVKISKSQIAITK